MQAEERDGRLFQALFEHALDAVLITDDQGVYVDLNPAGARLIGLPRDQIVGSPVSRFFELLPDAPVDRAWNDFLDQGAMEGRCRVRKPSGEWRICHYRAKAGFWPGLNVSILRDITWQQSLTDALAHSNRRLKILTRVTRDLLENDQPRELLARISEELSSELGLEIYFNYLIEDGRLKLHTYGGVTPDFADRYAWLEYGQYISGRVAASRTAAVSDRIQETGDPRVAHLRDLGFQSYICVPVIRAGNVLGTLSFGSRLHSTVDQDDVQLIQSCADSVAIALQRAQYESERISNNHELERANKELRRSNQELFHFAYAVGHDLKTPLRTIASFAQLVTRRMEGQNEDIVDFVNRINEAVSGMNRFFDDLLTYAQVGRAGVQHVSSISLELPLQWALMNLHEAIRASAATVTHDPLPEVPGDQAQMTQLFQNLIGNAIKYRSADPPRIHITATQEADETVVSVSDNGVGVDPEFHESIFEVFRRLHGSQIPGTGLGLALCRRIVENYGGKIWIESQPQGSVFRFSIPNL